MSVLQPLPRAGVQVDSLWLVNPLLLSPFLPPPSPLTRSPHPPLSFSGPLNTEIVIINTVMHKYVRYSLHGCHFLNN